MKIVLLTNEYPPDNLGGIGTQTYIKAHGFTEFGHEVYIVCPSNEGKRYEYKDKKVNVIRFKVESKLSVQNIITDMLLYSIAVAEEIQNLNLKTEIDIIDFPELWNYSSVHLLNSNEAIKAKTVIQIHSSLVALSKNTGWPLIDSELYKIGTSLEGASFRLAHGIYSSSKHSTDICIKHYGLKNVKIPTIHTGIDTSIFFPNKIKKENLTIVFVGRISGAKGAIEAVTACSNLAKEFPNLKLKMIGEEHQKEIIPKLHEIIKDNGAENVVEFMGPVDRALLPEILSNADIFLLPSYYEGGPGFSYLEAMSSGLPVIACNEGGMPEIIKNNKNGFLIPKGNVKELTIVLRKLLRDKDLREKIGENAREYVVKYADTKDCLRKIEEFYKKIITI